MGCIKSNRKNCILFLKAQYIFKKSFDQLKKNNIKDLKSFTKIMNQENISRKECLLLPFRTLSKALNL